MCVYVCLKTPHILVESVVQLCHVVIASVTIVLQLTKLLELGRCTGITRTRPTGVDVLTGGVRTIRVSCVSSELVGHTGLECD